jgi:hypothetical protein
MDVSWLYTKSTWIRGLDHLTTLTSNEGCHYVDEDGCSVLDTPPPCEQPDPTEDINIHGFDRYTLPKLDGYDHMSLAVQGAGFAPVFCANGPGFQACATSTQFGQRFYANLDFDSSGDTSWKKATVLVVTSEDSFQLGPQATSPAQLTDGKYGMMADYLVSGGSNVQCP